jgi:hypothetical protein
MNFPVLNGRVLCFVGFHPTPHQDLHLPVVGYLGNREVILASILRILPTNFLTPDPVIVIHPKTAGAGRQALRGVWGGSP